MPKTSAGLLMYRVRDEAFEVFLVHPGGPFWTKKDSGAWFLPKGEINSDEEPLIAAQREFTEETGLTARGPFISLGTIQHKTGKIVQAWAFTGDCDPTLVTSNTFEMEWPPRSGKLRKFPEVDHADFFREDIARHKMHPAEFEFVLRLAKILSPR